VTEQGVTEQFGRAILLIHLAATLFLVGLIWFVQVVHYPLLARVGATDAPAYEQAHTRRIVPVVAPPMLTELFSGLLLIWFRPSGIADEQVGVGLALLVVIWISTQFVQVPCHERLCRAFDPAVHRQLIATNWIRTATWTLRGGLVLWMTWNILL
jgi:hypothetical protein